MKPASPILPKQDGGGGPCTSAECNEPERQTRRGEAELMVAAAVEGGWRPPKSPSGRQAGATVTKSSFLGSLLEKASDSG